MMKCVVASKAATEAKVGQLVKGAIYNLTSEGLFITPERWIAFYIVPNDEKAKSWGDG